MGSTKTQIRAARAQDAPAIAKIHVDTWKVAYRGQIPDDYLDALDTDRRNKVWSAILAAEKGTVLLALDGPRIVGFCHLIPSRDEDASNKTAEITAIYVEPAEWGKGYGRDLCSSAVAQANRCGFSEVTLWVLDSNRAARDFYEKIGFELDGETKTEDRPGFKLNEIRYRLSTTAV